MFQSEWSIVPNHTNTITFVDLDGVVPHHHYKADGVVFDQNFKFKMVLVFCTNTIYHGGWCFAVEVRKMTHMVLKSSDIP